MAKDRAATLAALRRAADAAAVPAERDEKALIDAAVACVVKSWWRGHLSGVAEDAGFSVPRLTIEVKKQHPDWLEWAIEERRADKQAMDTWSRAAQLAERQRRKTQLAALREQAGIVALGERRRASATTAERAEKALWDEAIRQVMTSHERGHLPAVAEQAEVDPQQLRDKINAAHQGWFEQAAAKRRQAAPKQQTVAGQGTKPRHSADTKEAALEFYRSHPDLSIAQAAHELGLVAETLRRWVRAEEAADKGSQRGRRRTPGA